MTLTRLKHTKDGGVLAVAVQPHACRLLPRASVCRHCGLYTVMTDFFNADLYLSLAK